MPNRSSCTHHAGPGLNLALPMAERGERRNDNVRPSNTQELALECQRGNGLGCLSKSLQINILPDLNTFPLGHNQYLMLKRWRAIMRGEMMGKAMPRSNIIGCLLHAPA